MKKKYKAVYTVEASWIISLCLIFTGGAICLGFDIYHEASQYVQGAEDDFDAVNLFWKRGLIPDEIMVQKTT